jgi:hypothetical protein
MGITNKVVVVVVRRDSVGGWAQAAADVAVGEEMSGTACFPGGAQHGYVDLSRCLLSEWQAASR